MDQLASENHTYKATKAERLTYTVAMGGFTQMWHTSIRYQQGINLISKKGVVDNAPPQASGGRKETCHMVTQFLFFFLAMACWWSPILSTRLKDGMTTDSTGQPVPCGLISFAERVSTCREFKIFIVEEIGYT